RRRRGHGRRAADDRRDDGEGHLRERQPGHPRPRRHLRPAPGRRRRGRPGADRPAVRDSRLLVPRSRREPDPHPGAAMTERDTASTSAPALIDARIAELGDWRGETLARLRSLIREADPDAVEEWKWRGTPVWSHDGIICTGETYKSVVKMTFFKGASLDDPAGLFNSSLEGNARRAIDIREGEAIDEEALKALVRAAV